ncbi:carbohydrate ABC transporter permease [Candidatus Chlorohelix allophototropha]|uniref:Carbohydrate ABC transporter permease n=2 Tax=Candidatus Chlorohelix allophototropha TaxID=3003348 RepID=A0ABY9B830_9CHLR|nr:carbohydrate ABC transporter permease [Chloroflexota bacterium L227-S17]
MRGLFGKRFAAEAIPLSGTRSWRRIGGLFVIYTVLAVGSLLYILPLVWMFLTSLKPSYQVSSPDWLPDPFEWSNYPRSFTYTGLDFGKLYLNSFVITILNVVGTMVSSTFVAYGFARLRAPGKNLLFIVLLATMMIPFPVTMVPTFALFNFLGWIDTLLPVIVPAFFGNAFNIFLLRQFLMTIPIEFEEAARIDGANTPQIIFRIMMPLILPAEAAVAVLTFQNTWNDYLTPQIYIRDQSLYTVAQGIRFLRGSINPQWELMMAAALLAMLPVVILYLLAQRFFIEGITLTGIK